MGRGRELRPVHEKEMSLQLQTKAQQTSPPSVTPVRGTLLQRQCACGGTGGELAGECEECHKKKLVGPSGSLQRASANSATQEPNEAPPIVHEVLRSPGRPLDTATRAFFEPRFGHDFSRVRIHTDARAVESARAVNALAYVVRSNMVFGENQYDPMTWRGRHLLGHELAHVVQQSETTGSVTTACFEKQHNAAEAQAERAAAQVENGRPPRLSSFQPRPSLQRAEGAMLAFAADLEQRKKRVVSIARSGNATISLFGDPATGNVSGYQLHQNFALTLAKDARPADYAIIQWIKGEMYESRKEGKVYWPANAGGALFGRSEKEPWLFNDWIIDSPDADPRFGSDRGITIKVPTTNFSDSPGIVMKKGELPAGLRWTVKARMGVSPWGTRIPTTIKEWESMRPEAFKEVGWSWDITVKPDKKSLDVSFE